MSPTETALFVAYPYLCLAVFAVGHAGRYLVDRYGWNARSSELLEKRWLFPGTVLFHFGVLGTLAGHAVGLLVPQSVYDAVGIDSAAHTAIAHAAGRVVGGAAFLGALLLLARRLGHPRVRRMSRPSDFVTLIGLVWVTGIGTYSVFVGGFDVLHTIAPWVRGLLVFQPDPSLMAGVPLRYKLHVLAAFTLLAYSPFCRLVHIWSVPIAYLLRKPLVFRRHPDAWVRSAEGAP